MEIENAASMEYSKLVEASIEANRENLSELTVKTFMDYQAEANKFVLENRGKLDEAEISKHIQELLVRKLSDAEMTSFQRGYMAGLNAAFDIVEAKAMEVSGGTSSVVN